ncbi:FG-GAP repeat domain-containing protein [Schlesneria paludicola]|uniref:FG-GAP repeat domain-containing protein n=1 Tax=Schlesneria paludicola TaxID=360056 RepID=UPI000299FD1B|nr:VCBS repeat-containing protein [Schlesneria paludicola]
MRASRRRALAIWPLMVLAHCMPLSIGHSEDAPSITSGPLWFTEHLVWGDGKYVYGLMATDIDGDGDLDLSTAGVHSDVLLWHENDGTGNLKSHLICRDEPGYLERHDWGDLNGDGRLDVVIVKNRIGHLIWFEQNGTPADKESWKRHVISTDFMRAYDVSLADLDGDGDLDVAASAYTGDCFSWFENPGRENVNDPWTQHKFDQGSDIANTRTIAAVDVNRDGKLDLIATGTYGHHTLWYENTGAIGSNRFRRHVIDDKTKMPTHGHPVDLDSDGDPDVIMAFGIRGALADHDSHLVAWYENVGLNGTGAEWKKHVIGRVDYGFEAVAGDLDGDGDLDVIASGCSGGQPGLGELCWFENLGTARGEWKKHAFKAYPAAVQVIVMDLDRDGKLDIAACSEAGSCFWWKNLGHTKLGHSKTVEK